MPTIEQRTSPRVPLTLQVQYPEKEGYFADATENLSAGGVFVRTDREFRQGDTLPLVLSFPGLLSPVELLGVVAWVRPAGGPDTPAGVGVRIPDDRGEDRQKLAVILEKIRAEKAGASPARRAYRILLVEDNPHIMEMYEYVMRKLSVGSVAIEVVLAADGHDALGKLSAGKFDLMVTDLFMPVLDGLQLIEKLRAMPGCEKLPVIAISAGGTDSATQAQKAGANVYLRKPVRFVDVVETVRALLKL
ncbi:MAG: TIGR02266 family protein [Myxococcales bacterium]